MPTRRHGQRLDPWIAAVEADGLPELHSYTNGLKRDHDAVLAGLTLPHSSGVVEGHVNRIEMIKRQNVRTRQPRPAPQAGPAGHLTTTPGTNFDQPKRARS
jgi:hypothetical protein